MFAQPRHNRFYPFILPSNAEFVRLWEDVNHAVVLCRNGKRKAIFNDILDLFATYQAGQRFRLEPLIVVFPEFLNELAVFLSCFAHCCCGIKPHPLRNHKKSGQGWLNYCSIITMSGQRFLIRSRTASISLLRNSSTRSLASAETRVQVKSAGFT